MTDLDKLATERVLKARTELVLTRRFYGVLVSNVEPVLSRDYPTMATDGRHHFFNPDFIAELKQTHLLGVQAHESEHDARHHHTRRGNRDPKKWNEATDYAINGDLKKEGFDLPDWVLYDPRFDGMSAEDIYRTRELDEKQSQPPTPADDESEGESGDDDADEKNESGGNGDDAEENTDDDAGNGDDAGEENDASDDTNDGGNAGEGDDEGDDESGQGGAGDDTGDDEADGEGTGEGTGDDAATEATDAAGDGGDTNSKADGKNAPRPSSGDPGRMGEVLDAATDASELSDEDSRWERIVRSAATMAKAVGQLPGHVSRDIERANNPPQDWREVLRAWFDQGGLKIETWNRPNRRFAGRGLILPGSRRDGVNRAAFLIDTSGSMDEIALACIATEVQAALDDGVIDEAVVIYGDTRVTRVDEFRTGDQVEFDPRGGGGTDLRPLFKYVADELDDVSLIVCFTDLYIGDPGPQPDCPVLFAVTGYPAAVRELIANAPWGAPGIDVGEH